MGILGQLVGWDQFRAQQNAVTAEYLLGTVDPETRKQIATHIVNRVLQIKHGRQTIEELLANLSNRSRGVQMQFVALACIDLGIPPNIKNHVFNYVANPYRTENWVSDKEVRYVVSRTKKLAGITVDWPGNDVRLDFSALCSNGGLVSIAPRSAPVAPTNLADALARFVAQFSSSPGDSADLQRAASIAYEDLLNRNIGLKEVMDHARALLEGPMPYSTHDLALATALAFFKNPNLHARLDSCQLQARLCLLDWVQTGKVNLLLAGSFEDTLYKLYKPAARGLQQ